jgi:hypothetical protein
MPMGDSTTWIWTIAILAVVAGVIGWGARPFRDWLWSRQAQQARRDFRLQREVLEARFFELAAASGKPRGLRWVDCDWLDSVTFARDRQTGLLTAFAAINVRFEAIAGGDMEGVEAVGNVRDAAAVFHYSAGRWGTGGKALFNLNPEDALVRLDSQYEPVGGLEGASS